ncbi:DUF4411 family protein [Mesorhizobium carmichaelinearum]|uniref:DUF4411 family protein n=1 Tax=Mesorhizobium carmichaelinearum TaxID=1208188 RepID=UPI002452BE66|nr:DUF4411 family protein [Mesorhizobium carmichaelinearum]
MATIYCIDTSALIAAWYERYKPKRFPRLWDEFDKLIGQGRLVSPFWSRPNARNAPRSCMTG